MDWELFDVYWRQQFNTAGGPMASSGLHVAGLLMLKHKAPVDLATLVKWRHRLGEEGMKRAIKKQRTWVGRLQRELGRQLDELSIR